MSLLFTPFTFDTPNGPLTLPNRIVIAPMCQYSAVDGQANDWHLTHWTNLLNSGAGMLTLGGNNAANFNGDLTVVGGVVLLNSPTALAAGSNSFINATVTTATAPTMATRSRIDASSKGSR